MSRGGHSGSGGPPRLLESLLRLVLHPHDRDSVLGDLAEEHDAIARSSGHRSATWWYAREVLRSLAPALAARVRRPAVALNARVDMGSRVTVRLATAALLADARTAIRSLARRPRFMVLVVGAYTLGIGVVTAAFSLVDDMLLDPLPWSQASEVVGIWERNDELGASRVPAAPAKIEAWRARTDVFSDVAAWRLDQYDLTGLGDAERLAVGRVGHEIFALLGLEPLVGRSFAAEETRPGGDAVALLSHGFWLDRLGGDPGTVGQTLTLEGRTFEIIGVLPEGSQFPEAAEVLVPMVIDVPESRASHAYRALGRLAPGVSVEDARVAMAELAASLQRAYPDTDRGWEVEVIPIRDQLLGDIRPVLFLLLGAGALVFLAACGNAASLLLVRASGRARELAIRTSVGAGRARLVSHVTVEAVILALLGGAFGLVLARWTTALVSGTAPSRVGALVDGSFDATVYGFALTLAVVAGMLCGLYPALRGTRVHGLGVIRSGTSPSARHDTRVRNVVVAGEVALAAVLLIGSSLFLRSASSLASVDLGFDPHGWVTSEIRPPPDRYPTEEARSSLYRSVLDRTAAVPGVEGAALVNHVPLAGRADMFRFQVEGRPVPTFADLDVVELRAVSSGYFDLMEIDVIRGRGFTDADGVDDELVAIVDEAMARRFWPGEDPLGQRISFSGDAGPWVRIVGVVESVRHEDPAVVPDPAVHVPMEQEPWPSAWLVLEAAPDVDGLAAAVRGAVAEVDPLLPFGDLRSGEELVRSALDRWRLQSVLISLFATVALLLAGTGVYGLMAYVVQERMGEMAIRRVLGAQSGELERAAGVRSLWLALGGLAVGLGLSAALSGLVGRFVFGVDALDPLSYLGGAVTVLLLALLATWIPARRAGRVDPAEALRVS